MTGLAAAAESPAGPGRAQPGPQGTVIVAVVTRDGRFTTVRVTESR